MASLPANVVARLGNDVVTKQQLNHAMGLLMAEDFYSRAAVAAGKGVVSEPMNYANCELEVTSLKEKRKPNVKAKREANTAVTRTPREMCHVLYEGIKRQAMTSLTLDLANRAEAKEQGVTVSAGEIAARFDKTKRESFPTETTMTAYLHDRGRTLADELHLIREELVATAVQKKVEAHGGGAAYGRYAEPTLEKLASETVCHAGYVEEGCSGWVAPSTTPVPVDTIIEEISGVAY